MNVSHSAVRRLGLPVVGFGLFKALLDWTYSSALSTASGTLPFVNDIRFSLVASLAILVVTACLFVVSWKRPSLMPRRTAYVCMALLAGVNLLSGLGLLGELPDAIGVALITGVYGLGSAVPNAVWLALIAVLPAGECLLVIAAAYLLAGLVSPIFAVLPGVVGCLVACVACVASIVLLARMPGETPRGQDAEKELSTASVRPVLVSVAGPLVVFLALEMVMGLVLSFQAVDAAGDGSAAGAKTLATLAAYICLIVLVMRRRELPDIRLLFERLFPFFALALALLPFTSSAYGTLFSAVLVFLQGMVGTSVLFLLLQSSREHGVPIVACVAGVSFVTRASILAGLVVGWTIGVADGVDATARVLMVAGAAMYAMSLVLVWSLKTRRSGGVSGADAQAEQGAGEASGEAQGAQVAQVAQTADAVDVVDRPASFEETAARLAREHSLTAREEQVVALVACGRSAVYIAGELGIAPETVRSYLKSAYPKLGVHSKQELIDLFVG